MSTTLKWGLITGMVYVIFTLIENMLGIQQGGGGAAGMGIGFLVRTLLMVATFFTIFLGVKESRETDLNGYMTMGQGFLTGFKIALIAGVITAIFTLVYMKFIDPDITDKVMTAAEEKFDEMNVPEEQREMSRKITGMFMNPYILSAFMIVWVIFWGIIKALVAAAILKKDPPPTAMPVV